MTLYRVYSIVNAEDVLTKVSREINRIRQTRFTKFNIVNKAKFIQCNGRDVVDLPFPKDEKIPGDIDIQVLIARHKILYSLVGLAGDGLLSVRIPKYIDHEILPPIKDHINDKYEMDIDFRSFVYNNDHFSKDFWGENITTKFGYNSTNKMYIKISAVNLDKLLRKNPNLEKYYINGTIKSIKGRISDLEYILDEKKTAGRFYFRRDGIFKWKTFDIIYFNNFIKKLIDKGFYGE